MDRNGRHFNRLDRRTRRPLEADDCALVVVDIQEKLLPPSLTTNPWSKTRNC